MTGAGGGGRGYPHVVMHSMLLDSLRTKPDRARTDRARPSRSFRTPPPPAAPVAPLAPPAPHPIPPGMRRHVTCFFCGARVSPPPPPPHWRRARRPLTMNPYVTNVPTAPTTIPSSISTKTTTRTIAP